AAFDVAHGFEILLDLPPVSGAEPLLQPRKAAADVVEHALLLLEPFGTYFRIRAVAISKQPLEHPPRIDLRRQRAARSTPRHRHVGARVARVAVPGERLRLETEFER